MLSLDQLGTRIMIMGPSNAGKSTLALALGRKCDLPVVHLDQLQHLPNTDWQPRLEPEFVALHEDAIAADGWIMEGNYSRLIPRRFERATGIIFLTSNKWLRLGRYLRRSLSGPEARAGHLEGGKEYVKWEMIDWILFKTPSNVVRYKKMIAAAGLPTVTSESARALRALYQAWGLVEPR
ncbi:MAG: AAA family ATPase [Pseudomonadota bacterium]